MIYTISCEAFVRLATIARMPSTLAAHMRCVMIEHKKGHTYAVATNKHIASVQYIGKTKEADGRVLVQCDDAMLEQCRSIAPYGGTLQITVMIDLQFASAQTSYGWVSQTNVALFPVGATQWDGWRSWTPDHTLEESHGAMFWEVEQIAALGAASPSGELVFPEYIDVRMPIVVRDVNDETWFGLFMGYQRGEDGTAENMVTAVPATLPSWFKRGG